MQVPPFPRQSLIGKRKPQCSWFTCNFVIETPILRARHRVNVGEGATFFCEQLDVASSHCYPEFLQYILVAGLSPPRPSESDIGKTEVSVAFANKHSLSNGNQVRLVL